MICSFFVYSKRGDGCKLLFIGGQWALRRLCLCQATFLRGSTASELPDNPELRAQLEALAPEALETRCRRSGLSSRGTAADQVPTPLPAPLGYSRIFTACCEAACVWRGEQALHARRHSAQHVAMLLITTLP
jgi:hypothetical protein